MSDVSRKTDKSTFEESTAFQESSEYYRPPEETNPDEDEYTDVSKNIHMTGDNIAWGAIEWPIMFEFAYCIMNANPTAPSVRIIDRLKSQSRYYGFPHILSNYFDGQDIVSMNQPMTLNSTMHSLISALSVSFPCTTCKVHSIRYLRDHPPLQEEAAFDWLARFKNAITERSMPKAAFEAAAVDNKSMVSRGRFDMVRACLGPIFSPHLLWRLILSLNLYLLPGWVKDLDLSQRVMPLQRQQLIDQDMLTDDADLLFTWTGRITIFHTICRSLTVLCGYNGCTASLQGYFWPLPPLFNDLQMQVHLVSAYWAWCIDFGQVDAFCYQLTSFNPDLGRAVQQKYSENRDQYAKQPPLFQHVMHVLTTDLLELMFIHPYADQNAAKD